MSALDVNIVGKQFSSTATTVITADSYNVTSAYDVSQASMVTIFVKNLGINAATVKLIVSPDDDYYLDDGGEVSVPVGYMVAVSPAIYSEYVRLAYKSTAAQASTTLLITIQTLV